MAARLREIIKEPSFEAELATIQPDARRADEFVEGVEWELAREPLIGSEVAPDSPVWFIPMVDVPGEPSVILFYTFDEDRVWLLSIQVAEVAGT